MYGYGYSSYLGDLNISFGSSPITRFCWCIFFLIILICTIIIAISLSDIARELRKLHKDNYSKTVLTNLRRKNVISVKEYKDLLKIDENIDIIDYLYNNNRKALDYLPYSFKETIDNYLYDVEQ